jgi:hypothetical protein
MRQWRTALILMAVSSVIGGLGVFVLDRVLSSQERTATRAVTSKKRADVAADTAVAAKKRTDRVAARVKVIRRVQVKQTRILITKGILKRGPRGIQGGTGPRGRGPSPAEVQNAVSRYCAVARCGSGPTAQQVAAAVNAFCDVGRCRGPAGSPGRDGQDALTPSETSQAVEAYCKEHDECRGPAGSDGGPGPQGPGPTDEQVQAAVNAYCSTHNNCAPSAVLSLP